MKHWHKAGPAEWELEREGLTGKARIRQVEGGFEARIGVRDTEFQMDLLSEQDFFESRSAAVSYLEELMEEYDSGPV
ncbi:MAG: hypothetical protein MUP66_01170 [Candidatus Nanohaloarchaeota archaeon QJJ-5]|nr:hypothetical protein [Candidatus Nanohaloarchaeota archaeon QJJ-5]